MPTCTRESLFTANPGYAKSFSPIQRRAAMLYLMALELAAIGGTDYTAVMNTTLVDDTKQLFGQATPEMLDIAAMNIAANNAEAAGADVPDTLALLNAATGCCFENAQMDQIYLFLLCALGEHSAQ